MTMPEQCDRCAVIDVRSVNPTTSFWEAIILSSVKLLRWHTAIYHQASLEKSTRAIHVGQQQYKMFEHTPLNPQMLIIEKSIQFLTNTAQCNMWVSNTRLNAKKWSISWPSAKNKQILPQLWRYRLAQGFLIQLRRKWIQHNKALLELWYQAGWQTRRYSVKSYRDKQVLLDAEWTAWPKSTRKVSPPTPRNWSTASDAYFWFWIKQRHKCITNRLDEKIQRTSNAT